MKMVVALSEHIVLEDRYRDLLSRVADVDGGSNESDEMKCAPPTPACADCAQIAHTGSNAREMIVAIAASI